jgi:hypothetical protein
MDFGLANWTEQKIGNCTYKLAPGTAPVKPRRKIRPWRAGQKLTAAEKNYRTPAMRNNVLEYLKFAYPANKALQLIERKNCELKFIKDPESSKVRFVRITYDRVYSRGTSKTLELEIPHWQFDSGILSHD